jgi:flavin-dependent dehydrogenase
MMYDVIVVGARCAGAPTAMLLARRGYRVLMVDRAGFPSDTLSTHYVHQPGVARLKRWGLLDKVAASNCPPALRQIVDFGPFALAGTPPPIDGVAEAYAPRRRVLDQILVEGAVAAGAELREHFAVEELLTDNGRVTGIRGRSAGGTAVAETAAIVIGADGMRSMVARSVGSPVYDDRLPLTCAFYSYWGGLAGAGPELYVRPERMVITSPTNDGQSIVIVYWPNAAFGEVSAEVERSFMAAVDMAPELAERIRAGERSERFHGTADLPFFFRKPYGPGWALVGDAGYHKDPITAQGISDAFRDAELLAEAIDDGLSGRCRLNDALADYERCRNEAVRPIYEMTYQFAALQPPPPEMQQLLAALRHDQAQADRFIGTIAGTVPIPEFFAPENVGRIMACAQPAPA